MILEEDDLLKKLKNKDRKTWEEFVEKNWKKLYNFAYFNCCRNEDQAKDLTQTVFTEFWNSPDKFKGDYKPLTYMIKTLKNRAIDEWRKKKKKTISIDELVKVDDTSGEKVKFQLPASIKLEDEIIKKDLEKNVRKIIIEMDNLCGLLLVLKLFKPQMSDVEISQVLDMTVGNIRVQKHRCLKKLKELFQSKGIVPRKIQRS